MAQRLTLSLCAPVIGLLLAGTALSAPAPGAPSAAVTSAAATSAAQTSAAQTSDESARLDRAVERFRRGLPADLREQGSADAWRLRQIEERLAELKILVERGSGDAHEISVEAWALVELARVDPRPAAEGESAGITGMVTESEFGQPITNASGVEAYDSGGALVNVDDLDEAGEYQFFGLEAGTYYVKLSLDDYLDELWDDIPCPSSCDVTTGTPVAVTAGTTTTGIDFVVEAGGGISGTVTETASGDPISNRLGVRLYDSGGSLLDVTLTDAFGAYAFAGVPSGSYFVKTEIDGYVDELYDDMDCVGCDVTAGTPVAVVVGMTTPGIDFVLDTGGSISGSVTESSMDDPISSAEQMELYDAAGALLAVRATDEFGDYEFAGLLGGSYYLRSRIESYLDEIYDDVPCLPGCDVTTGSAVVVPADTAVPGIDFALDTGGSITGTLTDSATASVLAGTGAVVLHDAVGTELQSTATDGAGLYTFWGLGTATYHVRTDVIGYFDEVYDDVDCEGGCDVTTGSGVAVTAGATTSGIDFALSAGGVVTGTVTEADGGAPVASAPGVQLYDDGGSLAEETVTDEAGVFRFDGLAGGTYFVKVESPTYDDQLYDGIDCEPSCDVTSGTPIMVVFDVVSSGIDFALVEPPVTIFEDGFESGDTSMWSAQVP